MPTRETRLFLDYRAKLALRSSTIKILALRLARGIVLNS